MKHAALSLLMLAAAVSGCGTDNEPAPGPTGAATTPPLGMPEPGTTAPGTPPPGTPPPETPAPGTPAPETPTATAGFPCDVHAVLQAYCAGCHLGQTYSMAFWTRAQFLAPYRQTTLGDVAATAVRDLRMPRYGASALPTAAEREIFLAWVAGGMPAGTCGELTRPAP